MFSNPQKVFSGYGGATAPSFLPPPFTVHHLIPGVDIGRVDAFAAIDHVPEAPLTEDNIVAPTAELPIFAVATAYPVGAP
jgi:hypothetical protein